MSQDIIVSLKLISGEELIGRLRSDNEDTITLFKIRLIQIVQTGPQSMGMAMAPYIATNIDGDITIRKAAIATDLIEPAEDAIKPYLEQTTSIALIK